jgi:hypothetical protein
MVTGEVHIVFWWGCLTEREHLEDLGVDGKIILKLVLKKFHGEAWTGLLWPRVGTGGGRLGMR